MTRENKLAIVIGFGLLLFVGILVSDHLSARNAQIANPQTTPARFEPPQALPGEKPRSFGTGPEASPPGRPSDGAFGIDDGRRAEGLPGSGLPDSMMMPPPAPPVAKERTHAIAKGETLGDVAKRYYGKRSLGVKLAEFNSVDPSRLKIGQQIKVPDIAVLDPASAPAPVGNVDSIAMGQNDMPAPQPAPESAAPAVETPKYGTVKVVEGDTLYRIAKRVYGDGTRWSEIAALNNLGDGRALKPGRELKYSLAR
jgi:nucleoid-associated protein YgaU